MSGEERATRLLVVEDERHLAAGIKLNLELEGYEVDVAESARGAGARLLEGSYDAILLDVMLPDEDGFRLCGRLRDSGNFTPVLMLTALGNTEDRVRGLASGADDYLVKPFELTELLARVRSMLRRRDWERESPNGSATQEVVRLGDFTVDFNACEASGPEGAVHLTRLEFDLLHYFVRNPGRVLSRKELQEQVWNLDGYSNSRMVDNFILRLRKRFEKDSSAPRYFVSVRGAGYKFVPHAGGSSKA